MYLITDFFHHLKFCAWDMCLTCLILALPWVEVLQNTMYLTDKYIVCDIEVNIWKWREEIHIYENILYICQILYLYISLNITYPIIYICWYISYNMYVLMHILTNMLYNTHIFSFNLWILYVKGENRIVWKG